MTNQPKYAIETRVIDMDSGKTIYHFQPNRGNLVTGILNTKGFIEDKLGINIKLWDSRAVEKKVNNVLRIRKR